MRKSKIKTKLGGKILLTGLLILVLGSFIYSSLMHWNKFLPGVEIGGIAVGGSDQPQALADLEQALVTMDSIPVTFYKDDDKYETQLGDIIVPVDIAGLVESAWQNEQKRSFPDRAASLISSHQVEYSVCLAYDTKKQAALLQDWAMKWEKATKDATLEIDRQGPMVVKEQIGLKINAAATFQALPAALTAGRAIRLPIVTDSQVPKVTAEMLQHMVELSTYSTHYKTFEANRSHNLDLATAGINKSMLAPGESFSFNNTVGQRTKERGYLDAKVIVGNMFEPGLGGGICQVSSTLYNAVLLAGLEIVERHNHSLAVAYVPLGRDATVAYGSRDFQFRNNTGSPVYIHAVSVGGKLTIKIYGDAQYKQRIVITNVVDKTLPFGTVTKSDPALQPGQKKVDHKGQPGYIVRSFRSFYGTDNKLITNEQLCRDIYKPLNKLILAGSETLLPQVPATSQPEAGDQGETSPIRSDTATANENLADGSD